MSRVLAKRTLFCHSDQGCAVMQMVGGKISIREDGAYLLEYVMVGPMESVVVPALAPTVRTDGLWQTTCFELFVQGMDEGYREFNFSPSGAWAAYRFTGYREGMMPLDMPAPVIALELNAERLTLTVTLDATALPPMPRRIGLSAVVEEQDGTKSYWALAHPPGKPDFHHLACFALELPAPESL